MAAMKSLFEEHTLDLNEPNGFWRCNDRECAYCLLHEWSDEEEDDDLVDRIRRALSEHVRPSNKKRRRA